MDNFDEIMAIVIAIAFLAIFSWGQYGISKASRHDFSENKK